MAQVQQQYMSSQATGTPASSATETVVFTSPPVSSSYAGCNFLVEFGVYLTPAPSTTGITLQIRRTNLAGTIVYPGNLMPVTASVNTLPFSIAVIDSPGGEFAGTVWVLTVRQTAGVGNGTVNQPWSRITVF